MCVYIYIYVYIHIHIYIYNCYYLSDALLFTEVEVLLVLSEIERSREACHGSTRAADRVSQLYDT